MRATGDPAVIDTGGSAPPLLLLHGAACNADHWSQVIDELVGSFRCIALDLPGHGRSEVDHWSWDAALDEIGRVIELRNLLRPAIVGHSLGGMLASRWAAERDCRAAMNLDGHGSPTASFVNECGVEAVARLAELREQGLNALPGTVSADQLGELVAAVRLAQGSDGRDRLTRSFRPLAGDRYVYRPERGLLTAILDDVDQLDLTEIYTRARRPLLVVAATRTSLSAAADILSAQQRRIVRELAEVRRRNPRVSFEELDTSHGMLLETPELVASLISRFMAAHP